MCMCHMYVLYVYVCIYIYIYIYTYMLIIPLSTTIIHNDTPRMFQGLPLRDPLLMFMFIMFMCMFTFMVI